MSEHAGLRVLIVEDEASIRRGLSDVLRFRGCEVAVAENGAEGLRLGLAETWDLIVLDIMLPELDGFTVCPQLRAAGRAMPILMLTAKGDEDDVVRGFESGANDYVIKPFGVRELTARLDALLRRSPKALQGTLKLGALEGTGLGLALVRDLVALMRGSVQGCNRAPGFEVRISLRAA